MAAVALDVDGVIKLEGEVLPPAKEAVALLVENEIPFCFLTNDGSKTVAEKKEELTSMLEREIGEELIVMAASPMEYLAKQFLDEEILVVGKPNAIDIARRMGFHEAIFYLDYARKYPLLFPEKVRTKALNFDTEGLEASRSTTGKQPIGVQAILIIDMPGDFEIALQLCLDILLSKDGAPCGESNGIRKQSVPVFCGNPDLQYASQWPIPRITCGTFASCLQHMFKTLVLDSNGNSQLESPHLNVEYCGKPFRHIFDTALRRMRSLHKDKEISSIYMIGDSLRSDIKGAINAGNPWIPVLVESGMYTPSTPLPGDIAQAGIHIEKDVLRAVNSIIVTKNRR